MNQNTPGTPSSIGTEVFNQKVFAIPSYEEFEQYNAEQIKNWVVVIGVTNNEDFSIYAEEFYSNKLKGQQLLRMKDEELDIVLGQCVKPLGDRWNVKVALKSIKEIKISESKGKRKRIDTELEEEGRTKKNLLHLDSKSIEQHFVNDKNITPEEKYELVKQLESLQLKLYGRKAQTKEAVKSLCRQAASVINRTAKNQNYSCILVNGISGSGKTRFSAELYFKIKEFILDPNNQNTVLGWCVPSDPPENCKEPKVVYRTIMESFKMKNHCYIYAKQTNGKKINTRELTATQYAAALLIASHPRCISKWNDIVAFVSQYKLEYGDFETLIEVMKKSIKYDLLHICIVLDEIQEFIDWTNTDEKKKSTLYQAMLHILSVAASNAGNGVNFLLVGCGTMTIPMDSFKITGYRAVPIPMTGLSVKDAVDMLAELRPDIVKNLELLRTHLLVSAIGSLPVLLVRMIDSSADISNNAESLFLLAFDKLKQRFINPFTKNDKRLLDIMRISMSGKGLDQLSFEDREFAQNWIIYGILQENEDMKLYVPFIILISYINENEKLCEFGRFFLDYICRMLKGEDYTSIDFEKLVAKFLHLMFAVLSLLGIKQIPVGDLFPLGTMHEALRYSMIDIPDYPIPCYFDLTDQTQNDYSNYVTNVKHKGINVTEDFTYKDGYVAHIDNSAEDVEISTPTHIIMIECKYWSKNNVPIIPGTLSIHPDKILSTENKDEKNTFLHEQSAAEEQFRSITEKYSGSNYAKKNCIFVFCCNAFMSDNLFEMKNNGGYLEVSWKEGVNLRNEKMLVLHYNSIILSKPDKSLQTTFPLLLVNYLVPKNAQKEMEDELKAYFGRDYSVTDLRKLISDEKKKLQVKDKLKADLESIAYQLIKNKEKNLQ